MKYKILILVLITLASCESNSDSKLTLTNKSKEEIFVRITSDKKEADYLLSNNNSGAWDCMGHYLEIDSLARFPAWYKWETFIDQFPDKKVFFYVFDADEFREYRSGNRDKNQLKYKQLEFTKEQLIKMNWEVVFRDSI
ncbi:MAG: hypothetical protein HXX09_08745 [Bacteroidetes bacterium]|nr:hypothetical protein [Bacteroidota bacterium]